MKKKKQPIVLAKCYDKRGKLISSAFNSYTKTHPIMQFLAKATGQNHQRVYLHAEVLALLRAKDHVAHTIVVERYHKDGTPAKAQPCPMCNMYLHMMGVKKVIHT